MIYEIVWKSSMFNRFLLTHIMLGPIGIATKLDWSETVTWRFHGKAIPQIEHRDVIPYFNVLYRPLLMNRSLRNLSFGTWFHKNQIILKFKINRFKLITKMNIIVAAILLNRKLDFWLAANVTLQEHYLSRVIWNLYMRGYVLRNWKVTTLGFCLQNKWRSKVKGQGVKVTCQCQWLQRSQSKINIKT